MSWDIYVYAETRPNSSHGEFIDWKPLVDKCVCDNFKYFNDGFTDELPRMKASEATHPTVKALASNSFGGEFYVNYCSLKDIRKHYFNIIDNFNTNMKAVYSALGVSNLYIDDEDYLCDEDDEVNESVESSDRPNPWVKYMTFPVNKKMFAELAMYMHKYNRALQVIGMCDALSSMCENYDDEIRLIFAVL